MFVITFCNSPGFLFFLVRKRFHTTKLAKLWMLRKFPKFQVCLLETLVTVSKTRHLCPLKDYIPFHPLTLLRVRITDFTLSKLSTRSVGTAPGVNGFIIFRSSFTHFLLRVIHTLLLHYYMYVLHQTILLINGTSLGVNRSKLNSGVLVKNHVHFIFAVVPTS